MRAMPGYGTKESVVLGQTLGSGRTPCSDGHMNHTSYCLHRPMRTSVLSPDASSSLVPYEVPLEVKDVRKLPMGYALWRSWCLLLLLVGAVGLSACGESSQEAGEASSAPGTARSEEQDLALLVARDRAAALFSEERWELAREAVQPLVSGDSGADVEPEDLLRAALIELESHDTRAAGALLARVGAALDNDPRYHWARYRLAKDEGEPEVALAAVQRAWELAPDSYPTRLAYATLLSDLDQDDAAEGHLRALAERGEAFGGSWYPTVAYKLSRVLIFQGLQEEALRWADVCADLNERGILAPGPAEFDRGDLGLLPAPPPSPRLVKETPGLPAGSLVEWVGINDLGEVDAFFPMTLRLPETAADDKVGNELEVRYAAHEEPSLLLAGEVLALARRAPSGVWLAETLLETPVDAAIALDADRDGDLDLVFAGNGALELMVNHRVHEQARSEQDSWVRQSEPLLQLPGVATDLAVVDYDHEGDVDLLVVGSFGVRLLRNDGFGADAEQDEQAEWIGFTEATTDAGLPRDQPASWCQVEDFDVDQDVDLLLGLDSGPFLASNERGGHFSDQSSKLPDFVGKSEPWVGDVDGDGRPDLFSADGEGVLHVARAAGGWISVPSGVLAAEEFAPGAVQAVDLFFEGFPSLLWPGPAGSLASVRELVGGERAPLALPAGAHASLAVVDVEGDLKPDLLWFAQGTVASARASRPGATSLRLTLQGIKDEPRGRGAIVEVRAGPHYQRLYSRGEPLLIGLGGREQADVLRITWPNGVVQNVLDLQAGQGYLVQQKEGLVGSCPFLYAWNGETYGFLTDVLGGTPLGLPMVPGQLVPPDHDEFVLLTGEQLRPKDGVYEVQLTEELREVTYLDRVRLDVVDHPAGTEAHPNERFCFPPFPEEHLYVLEAPLAPLRAVDDQGRDWTDSLGRHDGQLATPYTSLGGQFLGLSPAHSLELSFDANELPATGPLRLALTGWFLWTDASVNVAAARDPDVSFEPPVFSVPDGAGGWRPLGPAPGFPAGKAKTMVLDVSDWLVRDDPRVRIETTLCLAWDAVRLAVGEDGPSRVTAVEADGARLWRRGFSAPSGLADEPLLETYDWDRLAAVPRWNQHPGRYTRYGDVLPLLGEADDRSVIFGSGDALTLRFPALAVPELPEGWTRSYLLYLDGWAKDRDPNTERALTVEPLPFHGMSGYPYGPDEIFPDDTAHQEWRRLWNTRPAYHWIQPLTLR